jgi:hypothetical protein
MKNVPEWLQHRLDTILTSAPSLKKLTKGVLRAQERLRHRADDSAWRAYISLEAAVNTRHDEIIQRAVALAYRSGRETTRLPCPSAGRHPGGVSAVARPLSRTRPG